MTREKGSVDLSVVTEIIRRLGCFVNAKVVNLLFKSLSTALGLFCLIIWRLIAMVLNFVVMTNLRKSIQKSAVLPLFFA